ncbi:MAG: hypothetical protein HY699_15795 [Deltaproteobacteria bacterium]|nr:hypothetical protein [Deltaproteobacteria bacterium]
MKRAVFVLALTISGCAFTDIPVTLPVQPTGNLRGGEGRQIVIVAPLSDERQYRDKCGIQKNAYSMETAKAICSMDPAIWVAQRLTAELKTAGFTVASQGAAKPSALQLTGSLLKIFVEPVIGFSTISLETDIHVKLVATTGTGLLAERHFFVKGVESGLVAHAGNFQTSVDRAADTVMRDMVAAIISLMNRYPELGLRAPGRGSARIALARKEQLWHVY